MYKVSVRKHEERYCFLLDLTIVWEDNIKIGLQEIGLKCVHWIYMVQNTGQWLTLVNTIMNFRLPLRKHHTVICGLPGSATFLQIIS